MARFAARRIRFGLPPAGTDDDDEALDLPRPLLLRRQARRAAGIKEAADTLAVLPAAGESLHCVMTARLDMTDVVNALLGKVGRCTAARIATLGYNRRNFKAMLGWLDGAAVGSLTLVASIFFRAHNGALWEETLEEFRRRGQRAACCPSHCKVMSLAFEDGTHLAVEGSANLCSNGSAREQFVIVHDRELCRWHSGWIDALVSKYEASIESPG
jgi:hypothetical protein